MVPNHFLLPILLIDIVVAVSQTCVWQDGSKAVDYLPCTNSSAATGNCCSIGDVCTANGMCYGGVGLIYRGACINEWGGDCLMFCADVSDKWVNFYPCPYAHTGSSWGPEQWWCGPMGSDFCTNTSGHFVKMAPSVGVKLVVASSSSTVPPTGSPTASTTKDSSTGSSAGGSNNTATNNSVPSNGKNRDGAMIGLGVGLGVLVLICAAAGIWALRSFRRQKALFAAVGSAPPQQYYAPQEFKDQPEQYRQPEMSGPPLGAEMDGGMARPAELGTGK